MASGTATEIAIEPSMYITNTSRAARQDRLEVGARTALEVLDVDGVDLQAREGDEGADDQGDAGQPVERRGDVARGARGVADGLLSISQAHMKKIKAKAGTMVPSPTPRLLSPAVVFIPLETTKVASQKPTSTMVPM